MKILIHKLVLISFLQYSINYDLCPRYTCDDDLGKDICAKVRLSQNHETKESYKDYRLFPCTNHKEKCQITMLNENLNAKCVPEAKRLYNSIDEKMKKLPGNKCTSHNECHSDKCQNSICSGNLIGELCESHSDCDVNLFCDAQNICIPQLLEGAICRDDFDCQNTMGCNNRICTKYYSLPVESESEADRFCSSGYIKNDKCMKGPKIKNKKLPYRCFRNTTYIEKCEYTENDGNTFKLDCECGINKDGASFCPLGKGDPEHLTYIENIKKLYSNHCHTLIRNDEERCDALDKTDMRKLIQTSWIFHRHHLLQNNEFCVKETILYEFYHLSSSTLTVINVFSLIILIVLIL